MTLKFAGKFRTLKQLFFFFHPPLAFQIWFPSCNDVILSYQARAVNVSQDQQQALRGIAQFRASPWQFVIISYAASISLVSLLSDLRYTVVILRSPVEWIRHAFWISSAEKDQCKTSHAHASPLSEEGSVIEITCTGIATLTWEKDVTKTNLGHNNFFPRSCWALGISGCWEMLYDPDMTHQITV